MKERQSCFACEATVTCEMHHLVPTRLRPRLAEGCLTIPLCVRCHDMVDRMSMWDNFPVFVRGYEPLWKALPVDSRLLLLRFIKLIGGKIVELEAQ